MSDITLKEIRNEIVKFKQSQEHQKLSNYFEHKTFYEILGISRREDVHSSFIAWLLNPSESHGLGEFGLRKFLDCVLMVLNDGNQTNDLLSLEKDFANSVITNNYDLEDIKIELEKAIPDRSRIDIFVSANIKYGSNQENKKNLNIIIENKVKAKEHNLQTAKYYSWVVETSSENAVNIPVFLTPLDNASLLDLKKPECNCESFVQINYQYLLDYMFQPCLEKDLSEQNKFLLSEYIKNLSVPSFNYNDDEENKGELIMAIGNEEKELLRNFWLQHKKILISVVDILANDEETSPEDRNIMERAKDVMTNVSKDFSTYKFNGLSYNKGRLVNAVLKFIATNKPEITLLEMESMFPRIIQGGYGVFISEQALTDNNRIRYHSKPDDVIKIENGSANIYSCNQWNTKNIEKFIEKANQYQGILIT